jgi:excisionase family DNA binding protein
MAQETGAPAQREPGRGGLRRRRRAYQGIVIHARCSTATGTYRKENEAWGDTVVTYPDLPNRSLLTVEEVAEFYQVTVKTVRNWCEVGELETTSLRGVMRIYRVSVIAKMNANRNIPSIRKGRRMVSFGIEK